MIATILPTSGLFHAVLYNEHKVSLGVASLLEIKNFGEIDTLGYDTPEALVSYLQNYSSENPRVKNPQFHLALSCKGHEMSESELLDFAHDYLKEMGYAEDGQPLLVYAHRDTDNTHIHIVTSRVDPKGKKIDHNNERRKSQKILDKLMNRSTKKEAETDFNKALEFDFRNARQFCAVMEAMNYECYDKNGYLYVKKGGMVQGRIKKDYIEQAAERNKLRPADNSDYMKWCSIFKKYRDLNSSRTGLEKDLRSMFGLSFIWFGKKDSPYGYAVVDFNKKRVIEGGKIISVKELLNFQTPEKHAEAIEHFIDKCMDDAPFISTYELNKKLKRMGGFVKKDHFVFGNRRQLLHPVIAERLRRNNKIYRINSFSPASAAERDLLCSLYGFRAPDLIDVKQETGDYKPKAMESLRRIFASSDPGDCASRFESDGWRMMWTDAGAFAYNSKLNHIVDMSRSGIPESKYHSIGRDIHGYAAASSSGRSRNGGRAAQYPIRGAGAVAHGRGDNREWEIGKKGYDPDDPDNISHGQSL